jgi:hypothetical protein
VSRASNTLEVIFWTLTFILFVVSIFAVLRRPHWIRQLVCAAPGALAFQLLTLGQLHPLIGALVALGLVLAVWGPVPQLARPI